MGRSVGIEEDADMRALLEQTLKSAGHEVVLAADGREGTEQYRASPADVVITDLYMPNRHGMDTIIELRQSFSKVTIIAMSGSAAAEIMLPAPEHVGRGEFLQKPFVSDELLTAVGRALRIKP